MTCLLHAARRAVPLAALALCASAAQAADPPTLQSRGGLLVLPNVSVQMAAPAGQTTAATPVSSKARAFKDHETGQLRAPTIEEQLEIAAEPEAAAEPVSVKRLANGTRVAKPGAQAMSHSIVRRNAAGKLETHCVTGPSALAQALSTKTASKEHNHDAH
jgi:hypothetical protein